jgi:WD40 repeat protein
MSTDDGRTELEDWQVSALLHFDETLAAGNDPEAGDDRDSLLRAVHECQKLLEHVWPRAAGRTGQARRIGRFTIVRELGRGGFGIVFLAHDPDLGRCVALKVPRSEIVTTEKVRRRFLHEARAASRLDHPHIVPVYEAGRAGLDCYIASAYCEGPTLAAWLRERGDLAPPRLAAQLIAVLAGALHHAHERGILHRDLKPGNILLQTDRQAGIAEAADVEGLGGIPRVCDFGLAMLLDQEVDETTSGIPIGSPLYMAPEQAEGRSRELGPPTDVYALGVILYEMLAGQPPFQGENALESLRRVIAEEPVPPRGNRPSIPRDLEIICLKCLEKAPARRYATAATLAEDLRRFLDGRPILARPTGVARRAWKWCGRRPLMATLLGAAAVTILVAAAWIASIADFKGKVQSITHERDRSLAERRRIGDQIAAVRAEIRREQEKKAYIEHIRAADRAYRMGDRDSLRLHLDRARPERGQADQREFVWRHLDCLSRDDDRALPESGNELLCACFSPDGRLVVGGGSDGRVRVWDVATERLRSVLHGTEGKVLTLAFSDDGLVLAAGGEDGVIRTWEMPSGTARAALPGHEGAINAMTAHGPSGLFTTGADKTIRHWDLARSVAAPSAFGPAVMEAGHKGPVHSLALPADAAFLATGSEDGTFRVRPQSNPTLVSNVAWAERKPIRSLAFSAEYLAVAGDGPLALIYSPPDRYYTHLTAGGGGAFVKFTRDGRHLATADLRGAVRLWRTSTWDLARIARTEAGPIRSVEFTNDTRRMVAVGLDGAVRLGHLSRERSLLRLPPGVNAAIESVAFSPDSRRLAAGCSDGRTRIWDLSSGGLPTTLDPNDSPLTEEQIKAGSRANINDLAFSPDGKTLITASCRGRANLWDLGSGQRRWTQETTPGPISFSRDGSVVATHGDHRLDLRDAARGEISSSIESLGVVGGSMGDVRALAFLRGGTLIAVGGDDIRLFDTTTRRELPRLDRSAGFARCLAASSSGDVLIAGRDQGVVMLWDLTTSSPPRELTHTRAARISQLALSPDGKNLACHLQPNTVTIWDLSTGTQLLEEEIPSIFGGLVFSPDGTMLAIALGGSDPGVFVWRATPGGAR